MVSDMEPQQILEQAEDTLLLMHAETDPARRKEYLLTILKSMAQVRDKESSHYLADAALITFINDPDIIEAWNNPKWTRWYA